MKTRIAPCLIIAALAAAPVTASAADNPGDTPLRLEKAREVIDDATITGWIKAAFAKDKTLGALNICVDTAKGAVRLYGTAKSKEEADRAAAVAKNVAGVASVKNDIQVRR